MTKPPVPRTQDNLDIEDIAGDMVILKEGSAVMVLQVSAVNFGLLSEKEQDATIYAYAQLLNSLTFSIQIVISSKRKDISEYLERLDSYLSRIGVLKLKEQLTKYRDFVQAIVSQGNVLDKKFYIAIPFSPLEMGIKSSLKAISGQSAPKTFAKEYIIDRANTNLSPKRDHLIRLLARIGLKGKQLTSNELLQLFFDAYNPDMLGTRVTLPNPDPPPQVLPNSPQPVTNP